MWLKEKETNVTTLDNGILKKEAIYTTGEKVIEYFEVYEKKYANFGSSPNYISYYNNGNLSSQKWLDKYYDDWSFYSGPEATYIKRENDLPNCIEYHENGKIKCEKWLIEFDEEDRYSYYERDSKDPNRITYYENGSIEREEWFADGADDGDDNSYHREGDLPSVVEYYESGSIKRLRWIGDEEIYLCRPYGQPNYIKYYENGIIQREKWAYDHKKYQNLGQNIPNLITRTADGKTQYFIVDNNKHRIPIIYRLKNMVEENK